MFIVYRCTRSGNTESRQAVATYYLASVATEVAGALEAAATHERTTSPVNYTVVEESRSEMLAHVGGAK